MNFGFKKPASQPTVQTGSMSFQGVAPAAPTAAVPASTPAGDQNVIIDGSTATFARDVIEGSRGSTVLVDFWAPWCQPCKTLTPTLEKLVKSYKGAVKLVKINFDENKTLASQLRIQSIPTVFAFQDGQPVDAFMGALPESQLKQFIDRLGPGQGGDADLSAALEAAREALNAGDLQTAAEVYAAVLQHDSANLDAIGGLAQCYVKSDDIPRAEQMLAMVPTDKRSHAAISGVVAAIELAKRAASAGSTVELEQRIAADPKDHQARIDLAIALAAKGQKEDAVTSLLEAIRRDRKWNEEAARQQLVQFFEAWGPKDPATLDGRRRLSSVLFS
jgi:putative thioredoxin